jgi:hypothetical protein
MMKACIAYGAQIKYFRSHQNNEANMQTGASWYMRMPFDEQKPTLNRVTKGIVTWQ